MNGIVLELQSDCLNNKSRLSDLLRKALVVAKKLNIEEIQSWIKCELNGYKKGDDIPEYRILRGEVKTFNPYNGVWMPIIFGDTKDTEAFSKGSCGQSVAEIESLIERKSDNPFLLMNFPASISQKLMQHSGFDRPPTLHVQASALSGILDTVRNTILDWALNLEEKCIIGEGLTFSAKEKENAKNITFNIGTMYHSQIQQDATDSIQILKNDGFNKKNIEAIIDSIRKHITEFKLDNENKNQLESDLQTTEAQLKAPNPKPSIIKESLSSLKRILEGAAGGAIASGVVLQLTKLLI